MDENQEIRTLLADGALQEGFQKLWKYKGPSLLTFKLFEKSSTTLQTPNPTSEHQKAIEYFWSEFTLKEEVFDQLFGQPYSTRILSIYFRNYGVPHVALIQALAIRYPALLVQQVRVQRVFLWADFSTVLPHLVFPNSKYQVHQLAWKTIGKIDGELWRKVEEMKSQVLEEDIHDLLLDTSIWIERTQVEQNAVHGAELDFLRRLYSLFISYLGSQKIDQLHHNAMEVFGLYAKRIELYFAKPEMFNRKPVVKMLEAMRNWLRFKENMVDRYCFGRGYELEEHDMALALASSAENQYRYLVDGQRYGFNMLRYRYMAMELVDEGIASGYVNVPKGSKPGDEEINRSLMEMNEAARLFFDDTCLFDSQESASENTTKCLASLQSESMNYGVRYETRKFDYAMKYKNQYWPVARELWSDNFRPPTLTSLPYAYHSRQEYIERHVKASSGLGELEFANFIKRYTFLPKDHTSAFNRLKPHYSVEVTPFIGSNHLFIPVPFLNATWFYGSLNAEMKSRGSAQNQEETAKMEELLASVFRDAGFEAKAIGKESLQGDADVIVSDGKTLLLMQLKRSYLRLNEEEVYAEWVGPITKASNQLLRFEKCLPDNLNKLNEPKFISKPYQKVHKWIVSTSFEHVNAEINGCRKINYFELLWALRFGNYHDLPELAEYLFKDGHLQVSIPRNFETGIFSMIELPIPVFDSKTYRLPFISTEDKFSEWTKTYNKAMDIWTNGNLEKAHRLLRTCLHQAPKDPDVLGSLGKLCADRKSWEEAFIYFEQALNTVPFDPVIWKNYAIALRQSGNSTYREVQAECEKKFPLLDWKF